MQKGAQWLGTLKSSKRTKFRVMADNAGTLLGIDVDMAFSAEVKLAEI